MGNCEENLMIKTCRIEWNRLNKFSLSIKGHNLCSTLFASILSISVCYTIFIGENGGKECE